VRPKMRPVAVVKRPKKDRNFHASNWLFAQNTHVDIASLKFCMRGRVREVVIYLKFHENRFRGLRAVGVENCPLPLTWPMAYTTACTTVQAATKTSKKKLMVLKINPKNLTVKKVLNGDTAFITQLLLHHTTITFAARRHNVNVLLSNSTFLIFAVLVV